ncbi:MAG: BMC domain-containing protein [Cloacibacillus sp.]
MKALGMMEFRGYVPAVCGLDTALKAAEVSLLCASKDGGGLCSVFITGGVGAVSAALSAVSAALGDKLLSSSVIPRPAQQTAFLLSAMPRSPLGEAPVWKARDTKAAPEASAPEKISETQKQRAEEKKPAVLSPGSADNSSLPMKAEVKAEENVPQNAAKEEPRAYSAETEPMAELEKELRREEAEMEQKLSSMTLKELRTLALSSRIEGFSAEKIRKAGKQRLIAAIMREQER